MASMSSYGIAVSGLWAAQAGLSTVGHNISNTDTKGFSRQQVIQVDSFSRNIGTTGSGLMQVGTGTNVSQLRQIRDKFLDDSYRKEASKSNYHTVKYTTGLEIETIFGELESAYGMHGVLSDMWDALNELTVHPEGIETRGTFIQTCISFINKVNNVSDRLVEYQMNLNQQVKDAVNSINDIVSQIDKLNGLIRQAEFSGDNANDYRDARNQLMDELSEYANVTYKNDAQGNVQILIEGNELLVNGVQQQIGLRYVSADSPFVEPVFTSSTGILPSGANVKQLYPNLGSTYIDAAVGDDSGYLKGILVSRGDRVANYSTDPDEVSNYLIPTVQQKFDTLVNQIVTLINDTFAPTDVSGEAPYGLDGSQFTAIFVRNAGGVSSSTYERYEYDADGNPISFNAEDTSLPYTMYTIGNIQINPELLSSDGYNKICLSKTGEDGDATAVLDIMAMWKTEFEGGMDGLDGLSVDNYYRKIITELGVVTNESKSFVEAQTVLLEQIDNNRKAISSVSMEEELVNMMKYQHAYNAASKVINVIDSMVNKIVNEMGRVGR